jgi:ABC-type multidrug transport system fused ATPase/permease subunit
MTAASPERPSLRRMLLDLFSGRERMLLIGVVGVSVVAALFETLGVISILPFMAVVLDPSALDRYAVIESATRWMGATTTHGKLLAVGMATALTVALGNLAAALNALVQQRFIAHTETRLSEALFSGYLRQPYAFHVRRDAASLLKILNVDVTLMTSGIILPVLQVSARLLVATGILGVLVLRDPVVSMVVLGVLLVAYGLIFRIVRSSQQALSLAANTGHFEKWRVSQEALGGIKELLVLGRVDRAAGDFAAASWQLARARASQQTAGQLPRYALETVAFGGILLITLTLIARTSANTQVIVPLLALYAFAGYRLLPALQVVFAGVVAIRFHLPAMASVHAEHVAAMGGPATPAGGQSSTAPSVRVALREALQLTNVSFTYEGAPGPALRDVSLTIRPTETIGLIGRTGSGKTTLADIILGLYEPTAGRITVDGIPLTGPAIAAWQRRVGYVSQTVYLTNASITENIALGLSPRQIDLAAVHRAAHVAQADGFIQALPKRYDTLVGERGVRLSGGQRQRIGIARALYHLPDVLVFDEATNALDGLTEDAVLEAIRALSGERTIVLIAHRLRTVEACDRIVMLHEGRVMADGSFARLLETSDLFRRLVGRMNRVVSGRAEKD